MNQPATFTGRKKRSATRATVLLSDTIARIVITLGGLATIAAVLLVGVFLFVVALPLFRSPTVRFEQSIAWEPTGHSLLTSGLDDSGLIAWFCDANQITAIELKTGNKLLSRSTKIGGLQQASAICHLPNTLKSAIGFEDGSIRIGKLGLSTSYVPEAEIPLLARSLEINELTTFNNVIYLRLSNKIVQKIQLVSELEDYASTALTRPITNIDLAITNSGFCLAALDNEGNIRFEKSTFQNNLLSDENSIITIGTTIQTELVPSDLDFIRVSGLGDQLFVFTSSGAFKRFAMRDLDHPVLMEDRHLLRDNTSLTHVTRLFGETSFVIGDNSGAIRILFNSRDKNPTTDDGLTTKVTATFYTQPNKRNPQKQRPEITSISASSRSRLFAVASSDGIIRLLQATDHSTVAEVRTNQQTARTQKLQLLLLGSRDQQLVACDGKTLTAWNINLSYPEASLHSLFGKIWYENYPDHEYVWETNGHESFEPKFSLVPLLCGTIKATLYSMLFAIPISIFGAIYVSQFMTSEWKSRIKPVIEMMASLPSVVLGFIAGLILAPVIESGVMIFLTSFFTVPITLLVCAFLWQFWSPGLRSRLSFWRFPVVLFIALPIGILLGLLMAQPVEFFLFNGDLFAWLHGRGGSGWGGLAFALFPLSAMVSALLIGRFINPWIRIRSM
ncbi:MAG: hypothetical protein HOD99_09050, partial [Planctomycetaceae bacterium]|nr:hypothetical protein [Planctomycetaceae bacterium]